MDSTTVTCRQRHRKPESHFLSVQLFLHTLLTPSVTSLGKLAAGVECFSFLLQSSRLFVNLHVALCAAQERKRERERSDIVLHNCVQHCLDNMCLIVS